ncbi:MAG: DMT family transporter [Pirellulales bacterium]|nr:DMT family transporter [Pirellulales bacterium]
MFTKNLINFALLIVVNGMWAAQYAAYKTATSQMGPITVSAWTFLIAALILLPFLVRERRGQGAGNHPERRRWTRHNIFSFIVIGFFGLIPASACLAWGTARSTASNAALIYLTLPILTALLASLILGERMTWVRWLSLGVSLAGVLLLSRSDLKEQDLASGEYLVGNLLVLVACTSSAFYNVFCKDLLGRFTALEVLVYGYGMAVMLSIPLIIWVEPLTWSAISDYTSATWVSVLVLSVFSWGLAMVLWMYVLRRLDVSQASVSIYLLPFLGVVIAAVTLHEPLRGSMLVGGLITLAGALMITLSENPSEPHRAEDAT